MDNDNGIMFFLGMVVAGLFALLNNDSAYVETHQYGEIVCKNNNGLSRVDTYLVSFNNFHCKDGAKFGSFSDGWVERNLKEQQESKQ